jgi:hypothetical protein
MTALSRGHEARQSPVACVGGCVDEARVIAARAKLDGAAMITALIATGSSRWDALLTVKNLTSRKRYPNLDGVPRVALCPFINEEVALRAFRKLAAKDPIGANAALNAYLEGRSVDGEDGLWLDGCAWVTSFPPGVFCFGPLSLKGTAVTALPDGLNGEWIDLSNTPIRSLPAGLNAFRSLMLEGCVAWDGQIPEDAAVGISVVTDAHRGDLLSLRAWRACHPQGEGR